MKVTNDKSVPIAIASIKTILANLSAGELTPINAFRAMRDISEAMLKTLEVRRREVTGNHKEE